MFKNILIIGCGMIGSSILRRSLAKKYVKKFMYLKKILNTEKNKK